MQQQTDVNAVTKCEKQYSNAGFNVALQKIKFPCPWGKVGEQKNLINNYIPHAILNVAGGTLCLA
jgi:hypothetical protein